MEQGPVLQARGYALGPVAAIAGQTRLAASVTGTQVPFFHSLLVCFDLRASQTLRGRLPRVT